MALHFEEYDTTPANWVADTKAVITTSTDWTNITGDIVKATTTRGAEMVINLNKATPTNNYASVSAWRAHNGTTGTDETSTRYLHWKYQSGGTTSNSLHCLVSASKEHLIIQVEGPYGAESNTDTVDAGSKRNTLVIADLVPYHAGDTTETVVFYAHNSTTASSLTGNHLVAVARNQGDTASWVPASVATVHSMLNTDQPTYNSHLFQHVAKGDGKTYLFPYVVIEQTDGLRGRINNMYWAGWSRGASAATPEGPGLAEGSIVNYGSADYVIKYFTKGLNVSGSATVTPFGSVLQSSNYPFNPQIAIKKT